MIKVWQRKYGLNQKCCSVWLGSSTSVLIGSGDDAIDWSVTIYAGVSSVGDEGLMSLI